MSRRSSQRRKTTDGLDAEPAVTNLEELDGIDEVDADEALNEPAPADSIPDPRPQHTPLWAALSGFLLGTEAWLRSHGGRKLRWGIRGFWAVVAAIGVLLLIGPVINPPLSLEDVTESASEATDRWIARSFEADYEIDRNDDGRLVATVEERITAFFPGDVDESGIVRVIPTEYEGHALEPGGIEVSLDGEPLPIVQTDRPTRIVLELDAGERLTGDHTFVIRYVLHDLAYDHVDSASGQSVQLLEWDVFGPSWPQAFASLDVSVSLSEELADQLVRSPRGAVAWLLLSAGEWLEPEADSPAGRVVYSFSNEQNIPPHANAWFTFLFTDGTFELPGPSPLFLVMSFGPLLPLAILVVTLLFALAARAVAWSDARGRPWYVAQSEPPERVGPAIAARVLGAARAGELAEALAGASRKRLSAAQRKEIADEAETIARRSGLIGDLPRAISRHFLGRSWADQSRLGLRRVPRGFVRDWFIAAPIAITLVQWGLVRQLSHQQPIAVVWWPLAFVLVSMAIAAIIIAIAVTAHPLTRKGALLKQYLLGIGVFAERTLLVERGTLREPLLPYAVLTTPPREGARRVLELIDRERGGDGEVSRWRVPALDITLRMVIAVATVASLAGAIAYVNVTPNPLDRWYDYRAYHANIPGTLYTQVRSFEAVAELERDADGRAVIEVTEHISLNFEEGSPRVPQFAQQWPTTADGQELGVEVTSVLLDGEPAPFAVERDRDTLLMRTEFAEIFTGDHELDITYRVASAAVAARNAEGATVERVRWAALLDEWRYDSMWDDDEAPLDPFVIEIRVPEELADAATQSGWITLDPDAADHVRDWPQVAIPFGEVDQLSSSENMIDRVERTDGTVRYVLGMVQNPDELYPWSLTIEDLGAMFDFPVGTFAGPDPVALEQAQAARIVPLVIVGVLVGIAILISIAALFAWRWRRPKPLAANAFRTAARWLAPAAALGGAIVGIWLTADIPADDPEVLPVMLSVLVAFIGGITSAVIGWNPGKKKA